MSKKLTKVLALALALVMVLALASCSGNNTADNGNEAENTQPADTTKPEDTSKPADTTPAKEDEKKDDEPAPAEETPKTVSYATATFGQKFSPFFSTTVYDTEVQSLVSASLLAADRGGAVIMNGIEGETVNYNGTDYTYYGAADLKITQNDDGTVDYDLTMRDDIVFSDGVKATIDDVIFGIYVLADPTYDGSSTIYALPIEGMEEYRSGMDSRGNAIFAAGPDGYVANDNYTEAQYNAFWDFYNNESLTVLAQNITDYVAANYGASYGPAYLGDDLYAQFDDNAGVQVILGELLWGFGDGIDDDGVYTDAIGNTYNTKAGEFPTAADYASVISAAYDGDIAGAFDVENTAGETAVSVTIEALGSDYEVGVRTGEGADNISGIIKTGDYSLRVHMTSYDAVAIYEMSFVIAPLHYYGDESLYNYDNNQFGFPKGDLSGIKAKTTQPLGAGPFTFEGYSNGVVTLKANESYFLGAPEIDYLLMNEAVDSDYVPGMAAGSYDIAGPSISEATLAAIRGYNSNGELTGNVITTELIDYRGYGYIGINADLVNIKGEPGSDASKALRKGFMTLFAIYRESVINSYYGDRANVIQYPISNTSWAAPQPADVGYRNAYSVDVDGNAIYDSSMSSEQQYAAAKEAAIGYFKAAGFTYDENAGKFTDAVDTYEIMIPGSGEQDHPAYGIAVAASEVLESIGITLQVNDVNTSTWNNALEGNTAMMWAAAWQSSVDPDMTQVYSSANAHGNGTNSNHYAVDDAELDALIAAGRASADTEERKSIYKEAMEIILDWGCELPTYQRKECSVWSTERLVIDSIPHDMTPYWGWYAEIETLQAQ